MANTGGGEGGAGPVAVITTAGTRVVCRAIAVGKAENTITVHKFVDHLRATGAIGVDGLISKLDRLAIALSFLKAVVLDRNDQVPQGPKG